MAATTAAVVGGVASAASSVNSMSSGGGGAPRWQRRAQEANYNQSKSVPMSVAGFTPDQLRAQQAVRDYQGYMGDEFADASAYAKELSQGINKRDIRQMYNPFEQDVVDSYLKDVQTMHGQEDLRVSDQAEAAGAFGGDREAVYRAVSQGVVDDNSQRNLAGIRSRGYEIAGNMALGNHGLKLAGNDQLQRMLMQRYGNRGNEIAMLAASGGMQQDYNQRVANLPQDRLRLQMEAAGQANYGARPPGVDPIAAAMHGYQGGYSTIQDLLQLGGNNSRSIYEGGGVPGLGVDYGSPSVYSDPLTFGNPYIGP